MASATEGSAKKESLAGLTKRYADVLSDLSISLKRATLPTASLALRRELVGVKLINFLRDVAGLNADRGFVSCLASEDYWATASQLDGKDPKTRDEKLAVAARRLEDCMHPGDPGKPTRLEGARNRSFCNPVLQRAIPKTDPLVLTPDMLPPSSREAFRSKGGDPLESDPLLRILTDRAAEAGFAKSVGAARVLKAVPSDACIVALCAYLTNQSRRDLAWRLDSGYSRVEQVGALEYSWRTYMDPSIVPPDAKDGKVVPDVNMSEIEALGMCHPPLGRNSALTTIDQELESLAVKTTGWQSLRSLGYGNPAIAVIMHCFAAYFHKETGEIRTSQAEMFLTALIRMVLQINNPDEFGFRTKNVLAYADDVVLDSIKLESQGTVTPKTASAIKAASSKPTGSSSNVRFQVGGASASAQDAGGSRAMASAASAGAGTTAASRSRKSRSAPGCRAGAGSLSRFVPASMDAICVVELLGLWATSGNAVRDASARGAKSLQVEDPPFPEWPEMLQLPERPARSLALCSPEFNATPIVSLPALNRAIAPAVFDFVRIQMMGLPARSAVVSSRFRRLVGAWLTHLSPWRSRVRSRETSDGDPAASVHVTDCKYLEVDNGAISLDHAVRQATKLAGVNWRHERVRLQWLKYGPAKLRFWAGYGAQVLFHMLPSRARQLVRTARCFMGLFTPDAVSAAWRDLSQYMASGMVVESRFAALLPPSPWSVPLHADEDDGGSDDVKAARRRVCDGRGSEWARERSVEIYSDFPRVVTFASGSRKALRVESRADRHLTRVVWADKRTHRRVPETVSKVTNDKYSDWEGFVAHSFLTVVHPLKLLMDRLSKMPMTMDAFDGRLHALLDTMIFLDDQVAETLWICSDLLVREKLAQRGGAESLKRQGVDITKHDRLAVKLPVRKFAALPLKHAAGGDADLEVPKQTLLHLQTALGLGAGGLGLPGGSDSSGALVGSMYHCRGSALRLCKHLVCLIERAKRHIAIYGDWDRAIDTSESVNEMRDAAENFASKEVIKRFTHLRTALFQCFDSMTLGQVCSTRYLGPNIGIMQFCLLRLASVFEIDHADIFQVAKKDDDALRVTRAPRSSAQHSGVGFSFPSDPKARREKLDQLRRQSLAASGVRDGKQVPRLGSHWSHAPVAGHEIGAVVRLTQRLCIAVAMAASFAVGLEFFDIRDDKFAQQRTARLMLSVAASARERAVDPGQAVLSRRQLVSQRMLPNWLRPLARTSVCLSMLVVFLALAWRMDNFVPACTWLLVIVALLQWVLLPKLQPQYLTPNFASPPTEVLEYITLKANEDIGASELDDDELLFAEHVEDDFHTHTAHEDETSDVEDEDAGEMDAGDDGRPLVSPRAAHTPYDDTALNLEMLQSS